MKLLFTYFKGLLCSPITYISIIIVWIITMWGMMGASFHSIETVISLFKESGIINSYNFMMDIGSFRRMTMFAAAIPFTAQFCIELKSNVSNFIIVRSSSRSYIVCHIVMCFFSAFAVVFIGMLLCIGTLNLFFPIFIEKGNIYDGAFLSLMNSADTAPLLILWSIFDFSFSVGMWAMSGLAVSAIFPDTFVALCAPLIMNYILEFVTFELDFLPDLLAISLTHVSVSNNRIICALYIIIVITLFTAAFAYIFSKFAGRRINNEMR